MHACESTAAITSHRLRISRRGRVARTKQTTSLTYTTEAGARNAVPAPVRAVSPNFSENGNHFFSSQPDPLTAATESLVAVRPGSGRGLNSDDCNTSQNQTRSGDLQASAQDVRTTAKEKGCQDHVQNTSRGGATVANSVAHTDGLLSDINLDRSYLGESGFLQIFRQSRPTMSTPDVSILPGLLSETLSLLPLLREAFEETYQEYLYTFCPVLDKLDDRNDDPFRRSTLLQQALAVVGTQLRPPIVPHDDAALYYRRAKTLFYLDHEPHPLLRIISIILLQSFSAGPPGLVSLDGQYFWMGIAIRLAHEIGLHREPTKHHVLIAGESFGLRRRIFWTLYVSFE